MAKSVQLALDVLETLADAGVPQRLTDIADTVEQPKPTVHRILSDLVARGYVAQMADDRYRLGMRCVTLGAATADSYGVLTIARPYLEKLNAQTRETILLAFYERGEIVYLDKVDSHFAVAPKSHVGARVPAAAVSTGRALLAFQGAGEIERVVDDGLQQFTANSVTTREQLEDLLAEVRRDDIASNFNSYRDGVCGFAAPVRDHAGVVVASIGCCLPYERVDPSRDNITKAVRSAAAKLSMELGYRPPHKSLDLTDSPRPTSGSEIMPSQPIEKMEPAGQGRRDL